MEFGLGDLVPKVGGAGVSDSWAFNSQLLLQGLAEVLLKQVADAASRDVVAVVLEVEEQSLLLRLLSGGARGLEGLGLDVGAGLDDETLDVRFVPPALEEAAE